MSMVPLLYLELQLSYRKARFHSTFPFIPPWLCSYTRSYNKKMTLRVKLTRLPYNRVVRPDSCLQRELFNLTPDEDNIRHSCKSKVVRNFFAGAVAGTAGLSLFATSRKLNDYVIIFLQSGAAAISASWLLGRTMSSCAEQTLKLDGSILQKEFLKIVVTKCYKSPELLQFISKHFYSEMIFDDSTTNNPRLGWRHQYSFSDHHYEILSIDHGNDSYAKTQGDCHNGSFNNSQGESENVNDCRTNLETKHTFIKAGPDIMAEIDPLDCLFGYDSPVEEIYLPNSPNKPSGTHNRRYRRFHRRHRMRNHDELSSSKHAAVV